AGGDQEDPVRPVVVHLRSDREHRLVVVLYPEEAQFGADEDAEAVVERVDVVPVGVHDAHLSPEVGDFSLGEGVVTAGREAVPVSVAIGIVEGEIATDMSNRSLGPDAPVAERNGGDGAPGPGPGRP